MGKRPITFSRRLISSVIPAAVGIPLLVVLAASWKLQHFAIEAIDNSVGNLAERLAADIDDDLGQRVNDLMTLAQSPLILDYHNNLEYRLFQEAEANRQALEEFLGAFAKRTRVYPAIEYIDSGGNPVVSLKGFGDGVFSGDSAPVYFLRAIKSDFDRILKLPDYGYFISAPTPMAASSKRLIYFAKSVKGASGQALGILVLGYDLEVLERKIIQGKVSGQEAVFIEDENGVLVAGRQALFTEDEV
ncbi:MAG: cache domain-containing protein, partial [Elusimicrobia bacterium]|nr:cache domain-containing protein [Elusimicrobiota bacterium]